MQAQVKEDVQGKDAVQYQVEEAMQEVLTFQVQVGEL